MRIYQITESARVMDLLNDAADIIISILPRAVPDGQIAAVPLHGYHDEFDKLLDRFPSFRDGILALPFVTVYLNNKNPSNAAGLYRNTTIHRTADLVIFGKTPSNREEWGKSLYTSGKNGITIALKSTLIHELRHHFQRFSYTDYYGNRIDDEDYDKNPIEVDAAWFHHLDEFDPKDYQTAKAFADDLMKSFVKYKRMDPTSKWTRHYYRKTLKYWLDRMEPEQKQLSLPDRAEQARIKKSAIVAEMMPTVSMDMREHIPGYQADNFILRGDLIRSAHNLVVKGVAPISEGNAFIILMILALGNPNKELVTAYIEKASGKKIGDIIDANPFPDSFDRDSMTAFVRKRLA